MRPITYFHGLVALLLTIGLTGCGAATSSSSGNVEYRNIWIINADGSGEAELVYSDLDLSNPRFSPDGAQITLDTSNTLSVIERRSDVYVASVNVDSSRGIATSNLDESGAQWSPDGTRLAFEVDGSIWVMTIATGATSNIAVGHRPIWSPDGQTIAYDYDGIRVVSANGGSSQLIGPNGTQPAWFSTGDALVYALSSGSSSTIKRVTFPGGTIATLASGSNPVVHPSTTTVVYERDGDLFAKAVGGTESLVALASNSAAYSPNGTKLAYVYTANGSNQIAVISVSATASVSILTTGTRPAWSPNSQKLVFEKSVLR
ncbi:hypothetical protein EBR57_04930 [bacterium]|nr:hypothetical protein [bacterium]